MMSTLPDGSLLKGRYEVEGVVGRGTFGIVYKGRDRYLDRPVAIKASTGGEQDQGCYMIEESQTLSRIDHPGVVATYDIFVHDGNACCVMRWLSGMSLQQIIEKIRCGEIATLPEAQALEWLRYILNTLRVVHQQNILHRDIKPGNIVFDSVGNPVLVDFGSALNRNTQVGYTIVGSYTPAYASPEQLSGQGKMGPWTDFYALAATFYELLTRRLPAGYGHADVPSPETKDGRFAKSIMRNLCFSPHERCQTAEAWLNMLNEACENELPHQQPQPWIPLELLTAGTVGVQSAWEYLCENSKRITHGVPTVFEHIGRAVDDAVRVATPVLQEVAMQAGKAVGDAVKMATPVVQDIATQAGKAVDDAVKAATPVVQNVATQAGKVVGEGYQNVKKWLGF